MMPLPGPATDRQATWGTKDAKAGTVVADRAVGDDGHDSAGSPRPFERVYFPERPAMGPFDRITSDPARMNGQPCVRNLRLTVKRLLEALSTYPHRAELPREYPELDDEDIRQALGYAAAVLDDKVIELPKSA
jgi:uncharacterized protein (DUF433 family)